MGYFGTDHEVTFDADVFPRRDRAEAEVMSQLEAFAEQDVGEVSGHSIVYGTQLMSHMDAARISKLANMKFVKKNMLYKALMRPVLEQADASGEVCYLETETERNLAFYEKHGLRVAAEARVPRLDLRTWSLVREPLREG